ncbi:MAG: DUF1176 domain-containing protein [Pseudomonadota bacterium]
MLLIPKRFFAICLAMLSLGAQSAPAASDGLSFSRHDWQLVCDNTRTCRAAGYSADGDANPVSVLLTRTAGPGQAVTGQVMLGDYGSDSIAAKLPAVLKLSMRVNGRAAGQVVIETKSTMAADLSTAQVNALLAALPRASTIEWVGGGNSWQLSDKGAAAALLKMDEFQGRIATVGALVRKGSRGEEGVLPPLPAPVVAAVAPAKPQPGDAEFAKKHGKALRAALLPTVKEDGNCTKLTELEEGAQEELSVYRLSASKLLVSTPCWLAAYNFGAGFWVINSAPPFNPVLVTDSGSNYSYGSISASHKGRGLGDCWSTDTWTWDGKNFIHTESSTTGMCKLIATGGAWSLPTIVTAQGGRPEK